MFTNPAERRKPRHAETEMRIVFSYHKGNPAPIAFGAHK
jgi:hypothetical protein